jgi:hypothetical protein
VGHVYPGPVTTSGGAHVDVHWEMDLEVNHAPLERSLSLLAQPLSEAALEFQLHRRIALAGSSLEPLRIQHR